MRLIRDVDTPVCVCGGGGGGEGGYGGGWRRRLYTYRYAVTNRMTPALRWAAMRAILMFHNCEGQNHTRQCPQTTTFEEKGEPKQIRTEVPLLTSLTPYRYAKPGHTHAGLFANSF